MSRSVGKGCIRCADTIAIFVLLSTGCDIRRPIRPESSVNSEGYQYSLVFTTGWRNNKPVDTVWYHQVPDSGISHVGAYVVWKNLPAGQYQYHWRINSPCPTWPIVYEDTSFSAPPQEHELWHWLPIDSTTRTGFVSIMVYLNERLIIMDSLLLIAPPRLSRQ